MKMNHKEFVLKYPEVVRQVQNIVFPCYYDDIRIKDAKHFVEVLLDKGEAPVIDMFAVNDSVNLYDIDSDLFEDYKDIRKDLNILLDSISKQKRDKNVD